MRSPMMDRGASGWFKSLNCDGRYGLALLAVGLLLAAFMLGGEPWQMALRFDRTGLQQGQWWRLLTGNLIHFDVRHLLLDFTGVVLLWMLFARELSPLRWLAVVLASMLAVDAGLWWLAPQIQWYVGVSGVLHGVWAAGAIAGLKRGDRTAAWLLGLLVVKLTVEQIYGPRSLEAALPVVIQAHVYGAVGGAVVALLDWAGSRLRL
jgi:rhomboid family GlyGly-CTERM serine protease